MTVLWNEKQCNLREQKKKRLFKLIEFKIFLLRPLKERYSFTGISEIISDIFRVTYVIKVVNSKELM